MIKKEDTDILNKFDNFCGDALDENKCYYIKDNRDENGCSFIRIEFYKPWFFYLQSFHEWIWWWSNTKCVFKCSDLIDLIAQNNDTDKLSDNTNEELYNKFSNDEIKIIKYISYLYKKKNEYFDFMFRYLTENLDNKILNRLNRDCSPISF